MYYLSEFRPYFELYQGNNGNQRLLCYVALERYTTATKRNMVYDYGCQNDAARSMRVCGAKAGTRIRIYDDPHHRRHDDWTEILVKKDMVDNCETIDTFEKDKTYGNINVDYKTNGNLDGKVSSFAIDLGK